MSLAQVTPPHLLASLIGTIFFTGIAASCYLWWQAFGKLLRGEPLLKFEPRRPVPWGLFDLLLVFLIIIFVAVALQRAVAWWQGATPGGQSPIETPGQLAMALLASSTAMLLACGAAVVVVRFRTGATWQDLGFKASEFLRDLRIGGAAFVMLAPPTYLLQFVLTQLWFKSEHPVQTMLLEELNPAVLLTAVFTAVVVAPLTEEIFFRVILQGWLENLGMLFVRLSRSRSGVDAAAVQAIDADLRAAMIGAYVQEAPVEASQESAPGPAAPIADSSNPYLSPRAPLSREPMKASDQSLHQSRSLPELLADFLPIAISAAIFALLHASHGPDPIPLFFLAIGLGYVYQRTHRATPCIVVHFLINGFSTLALLAYLLSGEQPPA